MHQPGSPLVLSIGLALAAQGCVAGSSSPATPSCDEAVTCPADRICVEGLCVLRGPDEDAGASDAQRASDAGSQADAAAADAGPDQVDAGAPDAGGADAGPGLDAGAPDASEAHDAGPGLPDASSGPICGDGICTDPDEGASCTSDCGLACESPGGQRVAFWRFETGAADSMGRHDLAAVGSVLFEVGRIGRAVRLDGSASYLRHPWDPDFDFTDAVTVAFWARANGAPAVGWGTMPFSKGERTSNDVLAQFNPSNRILVFQVRLSDDTTAFQYADAALDDQWHHYAMVYERGAPGEDLRLYVDGARQTGWSGNLDSGLSLHTSAEELRVAGNDTTSFDGWIDEVQLYSSALGEAAVAQLAGCY